MKCLEILRFFTTPIAPYIARGIFLIGHFSHLTSVTFVSLIVFFTFPLTENLSPSGLCNLLMVTCFQLSTPMLACRSRSAVQYSLATQFSAGWCTMSYSKLLATEKSVFYSQTKFVNKRKWSKNYLWNPPPLFHVRYYKTKRLRDSLVLGSFLRCPIIAVTS